MMPIQIKAEDVAIFKIPESAIFESRDKKVGRIAGDLVWNRDADLFLTTLKPRKEVIRQIPPSKIITDFYCWDASLMPYYNKERADEKFDEVKLLGCDKCVELDFSVWYEKPHIINLYNIFFANRRTRDMYMKGIKIAVNFNLITPNYFEIADYYLPQTINTMVCDNNHAINDVYLQSDYESFEKIYNSGRKLKSVIFIDGKVDKSYLMPILKLLERNDTYYTFIPSRIRLMSLLSKKFDLERKVKKERLLNIR